MLNTLWGSFNEEAFDDKRVEIIGVKTLPRRGIELGLPDFSWYMIPNPGKMHQNEYKT
jgi:hypothetical protein